MKLITPPTAWSPKRAVWLPRRISMRAIRDSGTSWNEAAAISGRFSGRPSTKISTRDDEFSPKPRRLSVPPEAFPEKLVTRTPPWLVSKSATERAPDCWMVASSMTVTFPGKYGGTKESCRASTTMGLSSWAPSSASAGWQSMSQDNAPTMEWNRCINPK